MRTNTRRWAFSLFLAAALTTAGCSGGNDASNTNAKSGAGGAESGGTAAAQTGEAPDPFGKYDPAIEVHAAKAVNKVWKFLPGDDISNNVWTREYESELGIKVAYDWTAEAGDASESSPYNQKLNVSIASGNLPDIFTVSPTQLKQLADAGQLEDLTGVFDRYAAPWTKELMQGDGGISMASATFDGKLLALPNITANIYNAQVLWLRTDWLEKLKLTPPKTMDELHAIIEAFTTKDPDGNGAADTYGIALNKGLYGAIASITGYMNGFGAYPGQWVKKADGQLAYGSTLPETKAALAKLQEMFKAGQIDREFAVKDPNKASESFAQNKIGVQFGENWNSYFPLADARGQNPGMDWKAYAIPTVDGSEAKPGVPFPAAQYTVVRKGFKHPEAAVKLLNFYQEKSYGKTRDNAKYRSEVDAKGEKMNTANFPLVISDKPNAAVVQDIQNLWAAIDKKDPSLLTDYESAYDAYNRYAGGDESGWADVRQNGPQDSAFTVLFKQYTDDLNVNLFGGRTETMAGKWSALQKLEGETFTKIIMGAAPIDEFDKFVSSWNRLGGETITSEINEIMDGR